MKIHHVGYLTKRIDAAEKQFMLLGFSIEKSKQYDSIRKVNIEFLNNGNYRVELVEPADKESPMYPLLKHYKNTPYHFCYIVSNIDESIHDFEARGYHVIQPVEKAPCIDDYKVAFLLHPNMGIIEFVEMP